MAYTPRFFNKASRPGSSWPTTVIAYSVDDEVALSWDGYTAGDFYIPPPTLEQRVAALEAAGPGTGGGGASTNLDQVADTATRLAFSPAERTKLTGIATNATLNDTDANLRARASHTGTQSADTLTDGTTNKAFLAAERTKLAGVATGATANSTDAILKDRANHTGVQTSATISDFSEAVEDAVGALLGRSTQAGITWTYDDASNTLSATVAGGTGGLDAEGARDTLATALVGVGNVSVVANDAADTITISTTATVNSTDAFLLARANHTGTQSADTLTDGTTNKAFLATERTKLTGIATGATANSADATLLARANHTGTQSADTLVDGTTNKAFLATERTKLTGVATGATANSSDAALLARANHTGTQSLDTTVDSATRLALTAAERTNIAANTASRTIAAAAASPAPASTSSRNYFVLSAQNAAAPFANPTGAPAHGDTLFIDIKDDGTARGITWGTAYRDFAGYGLPSTTVATKWIYLAFKFNATDAKWDLIARTNQS
jgi:YD repeat-containing protein